MTDMPSLAVLMTALEFHQADLAANQQGHYSEGQLAHLGSLQKRALLVGSIAFVILVFLATAFLFIGQQNESPVLSFIGILLTISNAIMGGTFARQWYRINADIREGDVGSLTGTLTRTLKRSGNASQYLIEIEGVRFQVKKEAFREFRDQADYALYFAPNTHILLSAEPRIYTEFASD